ncbi:arsenate reductase family protein [Robiginitalea sediminis]|uniref:arsenate reductase family protein n=1 Tax=Robiginitalea sediminis TaxID=1982593 RepID=UPI000B4B3BF4|nr:ArsC/Spx/MgsR family protein [Robiginitalea sediminis]
MKKIYHLSTCDTCRRILGELNPGPEVTLQDIKESPLNAAQLDALKERAGSYEALFSKRARLFRQRGLHEKSLAEADYRDLLLEHYTFLKRPVVVWGDAVYIGNAKKTVAAAAEAMTS